MKYLAVKSSQPGNSTESPGIGAPRQLRKETSYGGGCNSVYGMVCVATAVAHLTAFLYPLWLRPSVLPSHHPGERLAACGIARIINLLPIITRLSRQLRHSGANDGTMMFSCNATSHTDYALCLSFQ